MIRKDSDDGGDDDDEDDGDDNGDGDDDDGGDAYADDHGQQGLIFLHLLQNKEEKKSQ